MEPTTKTTVLVDGKWVMVEKENSKRPSNQKKTKLEKQKAWEYEDLRWYIVNKTNKLTKKCPVCKNEKSIVDFTKAGKKIHKLNCKVKALQRQNRQLKMENALLKLKQQAKSPSPPPPPPPPQPSAPEPSKGQKRKGTGKGKGKGKKSRPQSPPTSPKVYKCEQCNSEFLVKKKLTEHKLKMHTKVTCGICMKQVSYNNTARHEKACLDK